MTGCFDITIVCSYFYFVLVQIKLCFNSVLSLYHALVFVFFFSQWAGRLWRSSSISESQAPNSGKATGSTDHSNRSASYQRPPVATS